MTDFRPKQWAWLLAGALVGALVVVEVVKIYRRGRRRSIPTNWI